VVQVFGCHASKELRGPAGFAAEEGPVGVRRRWSRERARRSRNARDDASSVFLFVTPRPALWSELLSNLRERSPVRIVATAEQARAAFVKPNIVSVAIDSELPDGNSYDLCGWVRARFRDVPITILEDLRLDTSAHDLSDDGTKWTVSEAVRRRMVDLSVLDVTPESVPMISDAALAAMFGISLEELEREKAVILERTGFASMAELIQHVRNLPRDAPE
jgi:hypothetical protein